MLNRFVRIRDDLVSASNESEANIPIDKSPQFLKDVKRSSVMLADINAVTVQMQERYRTLSTCRAEIDKLFKRIRKAATKRESRLYNCKLGDDYLKIDSHVTTDPTFESGIVKLQRGRADDLTLLEKHAVKCLLKNDDGCGGSSESDDDKPMKDHLSKKRKIDENGKYMSAGFVLGSSAEVQRLWSTAKYVLTEERSKLKPLLFEAILFLKYNQRFWGDQLVAEAIRCVISERTQQRLDELKNQDEFGNDAEDDESL